MAIAIEEPQLAAGEAVVAAEVAVEPAFVAGAAAAAPTVELEAVVADVAEAAPTVVLEVVAADVAEAAPIVELAVVVADDVVGADGVPVVAARSFHMAPLHLAMAAHSCHKTPWFVHGHRSKPAAQVGSDNW